MKENYTTLFNAVRCCLNTNMTWVGIDAFEAKIHTGNRFSFLQVKKETILLSTGDPYADAEEITEAELKKYLKPKVKETIEYLKYYLEE